MRILSKFYVIVTMTNVMKKKKKLRVSSDSTFNSLPEDKF